jgi:hypothetical protein
MGRRLLSLLLPLLWALPASAQEGFAADLLAVDLHGDGLIATHGAGLQDRALTLSFATDWGHHLLGRTTQDGEIRWIVEDRLSLRLGVAYTPVPFVRLEVGFDATPYQTGQRTDRWGAPVSLEPGMGGSYLGTTWAIPWLFGTPFDLAVTAAVVFPTADGEALTGNDRMEMGTELRFAARFWILRGLLNLGWFTGQTTRYRDLTRSSGLRLAAGLEAGDDAWPLTGFAELAATTLLIDPFASKIDSNLEVFLGSRVRLPAGLELRPAVGLGVLGAGTPTVRGLVWIRWSRLEETSTPAE